MICRTEFVISFYQYAYTKAWYPILTGPDELFLDFDSGINMILCPKYPTWHKLNLISPNTDKTAVISCQMAVFMVMMIHISIHVFTLYLVSEDIVLFITAGLSWYKQRNCCEIFYNFCNVTM